MQNNGTRSLHYIAGFVFSFLFFCASSALFNYFVDPFGIFGRNQVGYYFESEREVKEGLGRRYGYDGLIMGSSKVGYIAVSKIEGLHVLNAAWDNAFPEEMYYYIKDVEPKVSFIAIGLDFYMFNARYPLVEQSEFTPTLSKYLPYVVSFDIFRQSIEAIYKNYRARKINYLPQGEKNKWQEMLEDQKNSQFDYSGIEPFLSNNRYRDFSFSQERIEVLQKIKELCEERGIRLYFWVNPYHARGHAVIEKFKLRDEWDRFIIVLTKVTPNLVNLNEEQYRLRGRESYWSYDFIHYYPETGKRFLEEFVLKNEIKEKN